MLTELDTHALASVHASLEDVRHAIQAAHAMLDAGRAVDLTGMDLRMRLLCTQALELPPVLAHATLADLMALRGTVDALIETLTGRPGR